MSFSGIHFSKLLDFALLMRASDLASWLSVARGVSPVLHWSAATSNFTTVTKSNRWERCLVAVARIKPLGRSIGISERRCQAFSTPDRLAVSYVGASFLSLFEAPVQRWDIVTTWTIGAKGSPCARRSPTDAKASAHPSRYLNLPPNPTAPMAPLNPPLTPRRSAQRQVEALPILSKGDIRPDSTSCLTSTAPMSLRFLVFRYHS